MPMNNRILRPLARPLLLDAVPGAAAAYSLRQLSNAYTGPVVTVRRSSDNAEADFKASEIDDGTLAAFCGAGDGFVKTWFDQSGNTGRDASQGTALSQPKIVDSGSLVTEGGKAAVKFDGVDDFVATSSSLPATNDFFATLVVSGLSSAINLERGFLAIDNNTGVGYQTGWWLERSTYAGGDNIFTYIVNDNLASPAGSLPLSGFPQTVISQERVVGIASRIYTNAVLVAEETAASNQRDAVIPSNKLYVGDTLQKHIGTISEVLFFQRNMTAFRQRIVGDINRHFGIF
jgi:hypothetical protein